MLSGGVYSAIADHARTLRAVSSPDSASRRMEAALVQLGRNRPEGGYAVCPDGFDDRQQVGIALLGSLLSRKNARSCATAADSGQIALVPTQPYCCEMPSLRIGTPRPSNYPRRPKPQFFFSSTANRLPPGTAIDIIWLSASQREASGAQCHLCAF